MREKTTEKCFSIYSPSLFANGETILILAISVIIFAAVKGKIPTIETYWGGFQDLTFANVSPFKALCASGMNNVLGS